MVNKKTLATILLGSGLVLSCVNDKPFITTDIKNLFSNSLTYKNQNVIIEGIPILKNSNKKGIYISDQKGHELEIKRGLGLFDINFGNIHEAFKAFKKEVFDFDNDNIKVFGTYDGNASISPLYFLIDKKFYSSYQW